MFEAKLDADEMAHIDKMSDEVRRQVEMYWKMWMKPMHYRDVFARFSQRLPKGVILLEFVNYCSLKDLVYVGISTTGKRYVFPGLTKHKLSADDVLEQIIEMERVKRAARAAARRTTAKAAKGNA